MFFFGSLFSSRILMDQFLQLIDYALIYELINNHKTAKYLYTLVFDNKRSTSNTKKSVAIKSLDSQYNQWYL